MASTNKKFDKIICTTRKRLRCNMSLKIVLATLIMLVGPAALLALLVA